MLSITESIINEGNLRSHKQSWEIMYDLSYSATCSKFVAPDEDYLYINSVNNIMAFLSIDAIESNFNDFDMSNEFSNIKKLRTGESWSGDGENIYIKLR